ncbi:MAG: hypothetical protein Q4E78_06570 [Eubacteriales bacterium]|nr:hypothetical protein [Eubacteriales bacterium]
MNLSKEQVQRKEFCDILFELAKNQELLQDKSTRHTMYKRLEALYYSPNKDERFRHFYSDIFTVLTQIQQDSSLGDINILGQNLSVIRAGYNPQNRDGEGNIIDIGDSIQKLYDHVSLDIARILYSDAGDRKTSGEEAIIDVQSQIKQIQTEVDKAKVAQKNVENELGKQQKEYIAILGIFAAVVLAFTGGIAFSTSVLNNINAISSYRIIVVSLIIGLVLINILFGLFFYVDRLVNGLNSDEKKLKPLVISNVVIIILLAITVCAWSFGWIEKRDIHINGANTITETTEIEGQ